MTIARRTVAALLAAIVLALVAAGPAGAGPTTDPPTAASYGAGWLARHVNAQGFVPGQNGADVSATANTTLALAAAGVGRDAFSRAAAYLGAHVDDYAAGSGGDKPAALGTLIMVAVAA